MCRLILLTLFLVGKTVSLEAQLVAQKRVGYHLALDSTLRFHITQYVLAKKKWFTGKPF